MKNSVPNENEQDADKKAVQELIENLNTLSKSIPIK
jgi:hypothetical protein